MSQCYMCGREISFVRREGLKPLVVDPSPVYFVPDSNGEDNFIYNGVWRRGRIAQDGLKGFILHKCEE